MAGMYCYTPWMFNMTLRTMSVQFYERWEVREFKYSTKSDYIFIIADE